MGDRQPMDAVDVEEALSAERFLLFKHSRACGTSHDAWRIWQAFADAHADVPTGWIEVRSQRSLSDEIARRTGVRHESPQVLWIRDGRVAWHASHWHITADALARAVET